MVALCAVLVQALVLLELSLRATASMRSTQMHASHAVAVQVLALQELSLRANIRYTGKKALIPMRGINAFFTLLGRLIK